MGVRPGRFSGQPEERAATAIGLDEEQFNVVLAQYRRIVSDGRKLHPRPPDQGRSPQTKEANLLDRLEDYDLSVLAFLVDPRVPFTNNQGERDIRMVKSKRKSPAGFERSMEPRSSRESAVISPPPANRAKICGKRLN